MDRRGRRSPAGFLRRRDRSDRGAAIIEAALVLPVFIFLVLGVLEGGRILLGHQTMGAAASGSARAASVAANDSNADWLILREIEQATSGRIRPSSIDRIVVYKASNSRDPVPGACLTGPVNDLCNVYDGSDFLLAESDLDTCDSTSPARFWCPSDRKYAAQNDNGNGPPDWIGVYIEADFELTTGIFADQIRLEDTKVTRIESRSIV